MRGKRLLSIFIVFLFAGHIYHMFQMDSAHEEIADLRLKVKQLSKTDSLHNSKLSFHDNSFRNVDFFGSWTISNLELIMPDSLPTYREVWEAQRVVKEK